MTLERTTLTPDELRGFEAVLARLRGGDDPELVYTPHGQHSYYRDLFADFGHGHSPGGHDRLVRHGEQMDRIRDERQAAAERALRGGGVEYRYEPSQVTGQGGYFTPPVWLDQLFANAPRPGRVLAALMTRFPLPGGAGSVSIPILEQGANVAPQEDTAAVTSSDITDAASTSAVVTLSGFVDVSLQLLDLSPHGAAIDFVIFSDLSEAADADLESQLILGTGGTGAGAQLLGVANVPGINNVTYTDGSPTSSKLYPYIGRAVAQVGNVRLMPPQCLLMRTNRWASIKTGEDSAGLPFDIAGVYYLGSTQDSPNPIGGLVGLPVFPDDAIATNLLATASGSTVSYTATGTEDLIVALRPTELMLFEGSPRAMVAQEPLSGALGARITAHIPFAALTGRRPEGICVLSGTGLTKPSGY